MLCQRGFHRRVPGRKPGADEHAAAPEAAQLLRPRHRGGDRAPGPDPGRHGAPLPAPPRRRSRPSIYPSPSPEHGPEDELENILGKTMGVPLFQEQAMRIAMVAAKFSDAEANELRRAMATFRRVGTIGLLEEKMVARMVGARLRPGLRAALLQPDQGLRRIRLSREPRRELRAARLRLGLDQVPLPGGVRSGAAEFAADGLLRAGADRARCARARRRGARGRREPLRLGLHAGAGGVRRPAGAAPRPAPDRRPAGGGGEQDRLRAPIRAYARPVAARPRAARDAGEARGRRRLPLARARPPPGAVGGEGAGSAEPLPLFAWSETREAGRRAEVALPAMPLRSMSSTTTRRCGSRSKPTR